MSINSVSASSTTSGGLFQSQRRTAVSVKALSSDAAFGKGEKKNIGVKMENVSKEAVDPKSTVGGGVQDVYGEDQATEEQLVTPWTYSVARYLVFDQFIVYVVVHKFNGCFKFSTFSLLSLRDSSLLLEFIC